MAKREKRKPGPTGEELWAKLQEAGFYGERLRMHAHNATNPWLFITSIVSGVQETNRQIAGQLQVPVPDDGSAESSLTVGDWDTLWVRAKAAQDVNLALRQQVQDKRGAN